MKALAISIAAFSIIVMRPAPVSVPTYTLGIPTLEQPAIFTLNDGTQDTVTVSMFLSPGFDTAQAMQNRAISEQAKYDSLNASH